VTMGTVFVVLVLVLFTACVHSGDLYGAWYCGDDGCTWGSEPDLTRTTWMTDRGDGQPTFNVIIFAFADPLALAQGKGVPPGMTKAVVDYFKSKGMMVMISIGGEVFSSDGKWDQALQDPVTLAKNVAMIATQLGAGIEIDYEQDSSQSLPALNKFVTTYRSIIPSPTSPPSSPSDSVKLLTVDMGAGTGYLTGISGLATQWLNASLIQWANAMVTGSPYGSLGDASQYWQQHLDGVKWANIPPMIPSTLIVSLYSSDGSRNCHNYGGTVLEGAVGWVQQKTTLGIFFWAVGCPNPPNDCATDCAGVQQGSKNLMGKL